MVSARASAVRLLLMVGLALVPIAGYPLGLGKIKVNSALNEPLNAEIDFLSISEKELKGIKVDLAPRADFLAIGAERAPILADLKFTVAKRLDGRYFVQLHTDVPFSEPFLHILVKVDWVSGQLVREYTALIDPPFLIAGKPVGVQTPIIESTEAFASNEDAQTLSVEPMSQVAEASGIGGPAATADIAAVPSDVRVDAASDAAISPEMKSSAADAGSASQVEPLAQRRGPAQASARVIEPVGSAGAPVWTNTAEYRVKRGDTLWGIARRVRDDTQLSMQQVILAIFRNNQDAFFKNNVNNLKAGKILRMPERESVTVVSKAAAYKEFRAQYDVWQEYKLKLAGASQTIKVADAPSTSKSSAPAPKFSTRPARAKRADKKSKAAKASETPAPEKATQPSDTNKDTAKPSQETKLEEGTTPSDELLKIVRATLGQEQTASAKKQAEAESTKQTDSKERRVLQERVTTLEESIESKDMETKDLSAKVREVRDQLKNEARLIEIENQKLAKAQQPVAPEVKATPPPPVETPKPKVVAPVEKSKAKAPVKPAPPAPRARAKVLKPPPRKRLTAPPPPPPAEKGIVASLMEEITSDSLALPIVGGGVALFGGGILLVYLRRRQKSIAEFEESILASDAIAADTGTNMDASSAPAVTTGDTSFLSDFSQTGMGNIHTDEVDPVAEADVYLAYGREETAEEILRDAIVKHPERQELKQKLLEIYHQRNDAGAFETLAEELYAALGGRGGKMWDRIEEMGRKLNPNNPMFSGGGAPGVSAAFGMGSVSDELSSATVVDQAPSTPAPDTSQSAPGFGDTGSGGGLDFDIESAETSAAPAASIDFDLDLTSDAAAENATDSQLLEKSLGAELDLSTEVEKSDGGLEVADLGDVADNLVDFDGAEIQSEPVEFEAPTESAADESEIQWEAESGAAAKEQSGTAVETAEEDEGQLQQWDETATKLDLAKAYIDMGDADGARSILDEVLAEGTEDQKKQAAELATQLS